MTKANLSSVGILKFPTFLTILGIWISILYICLHVSWFCLAFLYLSFLFSYLFGIFLRHLIFSCSKLCCFSFRVSGTSGVFFFYSWIAAGLAKPSFSSLLFPPWFQSNRSWTSYLYAFEKNVYSLIVSLSFAFYDDDVVVTEGCTNSWLLWLLYVTFLLLLNLLIVLKCLCTYPSVVTVQISALAHLFSFSIIYANCSWNENYLWCWHHTEKSQDKT